MAPNEVIAVLAANEGVSAEKMRCRIFRRGDGVTSGEFNVQDLLDGSAHATATGNSVSPAPGPRVKSPTVASPGRKLRGGGGTGTPHVTVSSGQLHTIDTATTITASTGGAVSTSDSPTSTGAGGAPGAAATAAAAVATAAVSTAATASAVGKGEVDVRPVASAAPTAPTGAPAAPAGLAAATPSGAAAVFELGPTSPTAPSTADAGAAPAATAPAPAPAAAATAGDSAAAAAMMPPLSVAERLKRVDSEERSLAHWMVHSSPHLAPAAVPPLPDLPLLSSVSAMASVTLPPANSDSGAGSTAGASTAPLRGSGSATGTVPSAPVYAVIPEFVLPELAPPPQPQPVPGFHGGGPGSADGSGGGPGSGGSSAGRSRRPSIEFSHLLQAGDAILGSPGVPTPSGPRAGPVAAANGPRHTRALSFSAGTAGGRGGALSRPFALADPRTQVPFPSQRPFPGGQARPHSQSVSQVAFRGVSHAFPPPPLSHVGRQRSCSMDEASSPRGRPVPGFGDGGGVRGFGNGVTERPNGPGGPPGRRRSSSMLCPAEVDGCECCRNTGSSCGAGGSGGRHATSMQVYGATKVDTDAAMLLRDMRHDSDSSVSQRNSRVLSNSGGDPRSGDGVGHGGAGAPAGAVAGTSAAGATATPTAGGAGGTVTGGQASGGDSGFDIDDVFLQCESDSFSDGACGVECWSGVLLLCVSACVPSVAVAGSHCLCVCVSVCMSVCMFVCIFGLRYRLLLVIDRQWLCVCMLTTTVAVVQTARTACASVALQMSPTAPALPAAVARTPVAPPCCQWTCRGACTTAPQARTPATGPAASTTTMTAADTRRTPTPTLTTVVAATSAHGTAPQTCCSMTGTAGAACRATTATTWCRVWTGTAGRATTPRPCWGTRWTARTVGGGRTGNAVRVSKRSLTTTTLVGWTAVAVVVEEVAGVVGRGRVTPPCLLRRC